MMLRTKALAIKSARRRCAARSHRADAGGRSGSRAGQLEASSRCVFHSTRDLDFSQSCARRSTVALPRWSPRAKEFFLRTRQAAACGIAHQRPFSPELSSDAPGCGELWQRRKLIRLQNARRVVRRAGSVAVGVLIVHELMRRRRMRRAGGLRSSRMGQLFHLVKAIASPTRAEQAGTLCSRAESRGGGAAVKDPTEWAGTWQSTQAQNGVRLCLCSPGPPSARAYTPNPPAACSMDK